MAGWTPTAADLSLTPASPAHAPLFARWREDPVARQFNPLERISLEEVTRRLEGVGTDLVDRDAREHRWVVAARGGQGVGALAAFVGNAAAKDVNWRMGTAEIGYGVSPGFRGQGLAKHVVRLLVERCFEAGLRRLYATVVADHVASRRAIAAAGFVEEGLLRQHFVLDRGPVDVVFYGLNVDDPR